ncbi:MAG: SEC-C domain-containing protein [Planctomycetes bacterium]|nr:SEC-C domain-containing protein [Planctomycetota bacterium]
MSAHAAELLVAAFLDSPAARSLRAPGAGELRRAAALIVASAYEDLGVEPRLLDGGQVRALLLEGVARRLGAGDALAAALPGVARAFFAYLSGAQFVPASFEIELALADIDLEFAAAARAVSPEERIGGAVRTIRGRGTRVGRNEPCPCGSGKKFKHCCAKLGQ